MQEQPVAERHEGPRRRHGVGDTDGDDDRLGPPLELASLPPQRLAELRVVRRARGRARSGRGCARRTARPAARPWRTGPRSGSSTPVIAGIAAGSKSARSRSAIQSTTPPSSARRVRNQFEVDPAGEPRPLVDPRMAQRAHALRAEQLHRRLESRAPGWPPAWTLPPPRGSTMNIVLARAKGSPCPRPSPDTRSVDASAWSPPLPEAPGFDHLVVETPGLATHVAAIGEGEPVVLLHGFPQHWWQWRAVAPVIAARGYRVLLPRPARGRLDRGRRSARRTRDPAPRPARPLRRPRHRARPPRLPRHGRPHRDAADLRPPRAGPRGRAALRAAGLHDVQPEARSRASGTCPGSSGTARAPRCAESSPSRTSPARCRRQPSKPTSPRCADPTSTARCVRSPAA